ncbi:hypothetical protein ACHZ97_04185 [Lysobacter soli]|uniref:hypothetical protein n=1 Tax=Lysobacter soli TaxID=453783 RepID=UPI0037CBA10E
MSKDLDRTQALHRELVGAIVQETGMREVLAVPIADSLMAYLQREYAGQAIYIPAPQRIYDLGKIRAALERGETPAKVCKDFGFGRRTLDRLFPGGLPRKSAAA